MNGTKPTSICFIGNQGGRKVLELYAGMAATMLETYRCHISMVVWLDRECGIPAELGIPEAEVASFESWVKYQPEVVPAAVVALAKEYREVNWSEVVAAERAFSDYSMLLGAGGERRESKEYVEQLVFQMVRFFEKTMAGQRAIVCQTADTLFSLVAFKVAQHLNIPAFAISPAWLLEPGKGGGFFANSEFLECHRMTRAFRERADKLLTKKEQQRVESLIDSIKGFSGKTAYIAKIDKGKTGGKSALSPNVTRLMSYLWENARKDKRVEYNMIDPWRKLLANLLRVVRKQLSRFAYGPVHTKNLPPRSVFYAIHFQPEQSTLAQGIWYVNQVALVENLSKALPLGYTLIVKEHPWGRGNRPVWQYRHMQGLYNVQLCDAPAKEIIKRVDAVVAVSGTVAMEALVFDKPTVLLGRNFFEFCDLLYRVRDIQDLPETLAKILLDGHYYAQNDRQERLSRFLMAYLDGLVNDFPLPEYMSTWAEALAEELALPKLET